MDMLNEPIAERECSQGNETTSALDLNVPTNENILHMIAHGLNARKRIGNDCMTITYNILICLLLLRFRSCPSQTNERVRSIFNIHSCHITLIQ